MDGQNNKKISDSVWAKRTLLIFSVCDGGDKNRKWLFAKMSQGVFIEEEIHSSSTDVRTFPLGAAREKWLIS